MKLMMTSAALLMLGASTAAVAQNQTASGQAPAAAAKSTVKPSQKALPALIELQKAVAAHDQAAIAAKAAAAQAVASTKEDRYLIGQMELKAAIDAKNTAAMAPAIDAIANSGYADAVTSSQLYRSLGSEFYNAKQYPQAIAAFQKSLALNPNQPDAGELMGEAYFAAGQKEQAAQQFQKAIAAQTAAGRKPDEALLKRAVTIAYESHAANAPDLAREWAATYPSPESWRNSIAIYRNMNQQDVEGTLDLLRLMQVAGAMTTPGDYALYSSAAAEQNNFNEAQAIIDAGIAAKIVNPSDPQFRDIISGLKTQHKATPADLEAARKLSPNATNLLRIGDRYYGMGDYAKAAEVYREVLAKPGADQSVANLHLGIALARAGDKAGAAAAFNAVTGARAGIAKYWLTYLQQHA